MLEIPESYGFAKQLNQTIQGKKIRSVISGASPHKFAFYFGDSENYPELLEGKVIGKSTAISGMIEVCIEKIRLVLFDGTNIRYITDTALLPKKHQLLIEFDDSTYLTCSIQMYGGIWVFREGENDNLYYLSAKTKPSPLTDAFTKEYFLQLYNDTKKSLSVKAFLATQQRIPGLGNGVLQDILFYAKLNPKIKLEEITEEEINRLYQMIKEVLKMMALAGGRNTEKDIFGQFGGYQTVLSHKVYKEPCPVCGGDITKQAYLGGTVYYCRECQRI